MTAVPNKYLNDLTAGACYGQLDFTDQPLAAQYVACLGCPVRDLCPVPTPWPRGECCRRGHLWGEKNHTPQGGTMIGPAFGLWLATWWPWVCPCGARGFGAASRQQHAAEHRGATL